MNLSQKQFGFRPDGSTIDAVRKVVEIAEAAKAGTRSIRKISFLITLELRNAFN